MYSYTYRKKLLALSWREKANTWQTYSRNRIRVTTINSSFFPQSNFLYLKPYYIEQNFKQVWNFQKILPHNHTRHVRKIFKINNK